MNHDMLPDVDHGAIVRLWIEIAWRVDHGKADTVHELFVDDGEMTLLDGTHRGREAILAWGRKKAIESDVNRHIVTNMRLARTGGNEAQGTALVTGYRRRMGDTAKPDLVVVGEYTDRFVKTPEGWRFMSRKLNLLFRCTLID